MKRPKNWSVITLDRMARKLATHGPYTEDISEHRAALVSLFGFPSK